jgi:tRNA G18 (ribose-2'-O)-methylase SpoU
MANIVEISHVQAPELDVFARLTEAQLRNRRHPERGLFVAESPKVISHALDAGYTPVALLMERRHISGQGQALIQRCGDVPVYTGDRQVLADLTGYELTRGILCAMKRPPLPTVEALCQNAHRVAVLEGIVDATNVGAIFRSAAALYVDAVLVTPTCCDPLNRRAVRVSMGTVFQVPWTQIGARAEDWPQPGLSRLKELGFRTVAMALRDDALELGDPSLAAEEKLAIVLGTEGDGLSPDTTAQCDLRVCIPMSHGVDSLNVAAASAVAFWGLKFSGKPPFSRHHPCKAHRDSI